MARIRDLERDFKIGYRHNPKQFYKNSFQVVKEGRRLVVIGVVKRHVRKRFRIVGVVKRR